MKVKLLLPALCFILMAAATGCESRHRWGVHDTGRPLPEVVAASKYPGQPPSDAIVLFNGKDLSQWESAKDGGRAKWKVEDGYMEVVKETGDIRTKQSFGSCQLHVEWATPAKVSGKSQDSGNSGVYLMSKYEVQVLNTYKNRTYADGMAGAMYGQSPPLVNVCRAPGEWQSYDIIFRRPVFKGKKLVKRASITVLHNGVLVQDNFEIEGVTVWKKRAKYEAHAAKLPLLLQDHGNPVRYRNIWIRELEQPEICNK
ncbi:MAG: DUF1080 domain-containing protein [Planctomycetota bacterium]|nr:MAG: DUF1080 domain-containing protein [Planctomycetota bacterium]